MKNFTRILPVLMIAILSAFITEIHGKVLTPLLTNGGEFITNNSCYPSTGQFNPVTPYDGLGSAELYSDPLSTGTLTGNVKNCPTNANLPGVLVTIIAGSPPTAYNAITNAVGNFTIAGVPTGTSLPVTATYVGFTIYGPTLVNILANQTTTLNFCLNPYPATLSGFVTDCNTGAPVVGAKVLYPPTSPLAYTHSTGPDGAFTLSIYPAYTGTVTISKEGFDTYVIPVNTYIPPNPYTYNVSLCENTNAPAPPFTATLATSQTTVNLNWGVPWGNYQLRYDDGIEDAFAIWQTEGNLDAVKFTPPGYPATLIGCMINIGKSSDYILPGHPVTFKVCVFDAPSPGGMPGNQIAPYTNFVVTSNTYGWYDYPAYFGSGITITSGSFYIVTKQIGNYPNAAGIALDTTVNQMRSFQKFVMNNGPWVPVNGNFMIRAHMSGPGGPLLLTDNPENSESIVGYNTWRFLQGQENLGPAGWTSVGTSTGTFISDNSWPSLSCQSYRWAVEAQYTGNRWSSPTFSNALGKCWTANMTVVVTSSCAAMNSVGFDVMLSRHNPGIPPPLYDSIYIQDTDTTGTAHFYNVYRGIVDLEIVAFCFQTVQINNIHVVGDTTIYVTMQYVKTPPWGLTLNDHSLLAKWNPPHFIIPVFSENWSSGTFTSNQWSTSGSAAANWMIMAFGNPTPSVEFNYQPQVTNYDGYLTSKVLAGLHSPVLNLSYDIYLNNFDVTNVNTMAVELWNGTSWSVLKNYTNQNGSIAWSSEHINISSVTNSNFRIRFHAAGTNSFSINNWNIDNIVINAESPVGNNACILGYNVFVNSNALSGFTTDTSYLIPCDQQRYGDNINFCVAAVYNNGVSSKICTTRVSKLLPAPFNLTAIAVTNSSFLTWTKPLCDTGLVGYNIYHLINGQDVFQQYVPGPDSLSTYCLNLDPGLQCFDIRAKYDLAVYGFPGYFGLSLNEDPGPACAEIVYGYPIPFFEPWEGGFLGYLQWTNDSNWIYNPVFGNPPASANFTWQPIMSGYNSSLTSMIMDASGWTCASIWLDFDFKLDDRDANGTENVNVEAQWDNVWHSDTVLHNNGSVNWTSLHFNITQAQGHGLRIRFRANGASTSHIYNWYVDNIHVYGIGDKPADFNNSQNQDTVNLTWNAPQCGYDKLGVSFVNGTDPKENGADSSILTGYNVFRYDSVPTGVLGFHKLNTSVLTGHGYTDIIGFDTLQYGIYKYFVTAVFINSLTGDFLYESPGTDTITIQFPAVGIPENPGGSIMIYPNPANDLVHVKSDFSISRIEVLNFIGQTVYTENTSNPKLATIHTSSLQAGVYFVRVTTLKGIQTAKITVVR